MDYPLISVRWDYMGEKAITQVVGKWKNFFGFLYKVPPYWKIEVVNILLTSIKMRLSL